MIHACGPSLNNGISDDTVQWIILTLFDQFLTIGFIWFAARIEALRLVIIKLCRSREVPNCSHLAALAWLIKRCMSGSADVQMTISRASKNNTLLYVLSMLIVTYDCSSITTLCQCVSFSIQLPVARNSDFKRWRELKKISKPKTITSWFLSESCGFVLHGLFGYLEHHITGLIVISQNMLFASFSSILHCLRESFSMVFCG